MTILCKGLQHSNLSCPLAHQANTVKFNFYSLSAGPSSVTSFTPPSTCAICQISQSNWRCTSTPVKLVENAPITLMPVCLPCHSRMWQTLSHFTIRNNYRRKSVDTHSHKELARKRHFYAEYLFLLSLLLPLHPPHFSNRCVHLIQEKEELWNGVLVGPYRLQRQSASQWLRYSVHLKGHHHHLPAPLPRPTSVWKLNFVVVDMNIAAMSINITVITNRNKSSHNTSKTLVQIHM